MAAAWEALKQSIVYFRGQPIGTVAAIDKSQAELNYDQVIPFDNKGQLKEAFNIRLEELQVLDIKFLYGCLRPTIVVLYQDNKDARHVKTYEVALKDKDFVEGPWSQNNLDNGAGLLIPVPVTLGGVIIIGEETIVYCNANSTFKAIPIKQPIIRAYGRVDTDGSHYLLGDNTGTLHLLVLTQERERVTGLKIEHLGETSIASSISYLDNAVLYVGSRFGDSQLVKLNLQHDQTGSFVEVLERYVNLGPIVDFFVVDLDRQGQGQVVTCSGAFKDGSVRVVRNGIGINEQASVELQGIKGLWSLKSSFNDPYDIYLVVSFISETRFLAMNMEDELEETEIEGFDAQIQTLFCQNAINDLLIQVFMSDFVPSALAFLMKGEALMVKDFLLETARLQSREKMVALVKLGQGVMPASFKVHHSHLTQKTETLLADFGGIAIGRVAPVDSRLWSISLPQHLDAASGALEFPGEVFRVGQQEWMVCGRHNAAACPVCTACSNSASKEHSAGEDSLHLSQQLHDGDAAAPGSSPPAAPASPPRPALSPPGAPTLPPRARTPATPPRPRRRRPGDFTPASSSPTSPPRPRRRRPGDFAPASSSPASPPRSRQRHTTRTRRGCGATRTSTPAGSASPPDASARTSEFAGGATKKKAGISGWTGLEFSAMPSSKKTSHGEVILRADEGGGGPKMSMAANDIFLARANRNDTVARPRLALLMALGPTYWLEEFDRWLCKIVGSRRPRLWGAWTWGGVLVGPLIVQRDSTCAICTSAVCLVARQRLDFERRYGFKSFPFHLTTETIQELKAECQKSGVWIPGGGVVEGAVLDLIREAGGLPVPNVPGWNPCKLQIKSWTYHMNDALPMKPFEIAKLLYDEGPVIGGFVMGSDSNALGWEDRIYGGARPQDTVRINHSVVCFGYTFLRTTDPNGDNEVAIRVLDNQRENQPTRWIMSGAFYCFCEVQVEPLKMRDLRESWWRRLLRRLRGRTFEAPP